MICYKKAKLTGEVFVIATSGITKNFVISGKEQVEMLEFMRMRKKANGRKNKYRINNIRRKIARIFYSCTKTADSKRRNGK